MRYASVVLDVDSTLCRIEGIDWLARRRGPEVERRVSELTDRAMAGEVALDAVYGERLRLVSPTSADVDALAAEYERSLAPGAAATVAALLHAGVRVVLVSGGLREAILPLAARLGVAAADVAAVGVRFDGDGTFGGHDASSPLAAQEGKREVVAAMRLAGPVLAVGDGSTDAAVRDVVDTFAAFTGVARREAVVAAADLELESFHQLRELVLG